MSDEQLRTIVGAILLATQFNVIGMWLSGKATKGTGFASGFSEWLLVAFVPLSVVAFMLLVYLPSGKG